MAYHCYMVLSAICLSCNTIHNLLMYYVNRLFALATAIVQYMSHVVQLRDPRTRIFQMLSCTAICLELKLLIIAGLVCYFSHMQSVAFRFPP